MKIVVTGATGYVGTRLIKIGLAKSHVIVGASRSPMIGRIENWVSFDFSKPSAIEIPADTDAIIHLAVNISSTSSANTENEIDAAKRLIAASQAIKAKFIFVSSQTARLDAPTSYGRTKWHIEQEVLAAGGWVVRPGQVYGGELSGLFGLLVNTVRKLPLLPYFVPAPCVQPIHVDDLSEGLLRIAERTELASGVYCLAAPKPVTFAEFLGEISQSRLRSRRSFFPIPIVVINALTFVVGESMRTRLGLERLRSLFNLPVMDTASDLNQLDLTLRPFHSGMHPSGNDQRRRLLQEGQVLFTYILKEPSSGVLLRRYVRAIEKLREGRILSFPKIFVWYPSLLVLVDRCGNTETIWKKEFLWRLDGVTILAEATPQGARRFLGIGDEHSFARNLFRTVRALIAEISWRITCVLLLPIISFTIPRSIDEYPR